MERADARLTAVIVSYRKNRRNHRIVFGTPVTEIRRGWRRKIAVFAPGAVFAYERWRGDAYGTQDWRLFICEAKKSGAVARIPGVLPGADILLAAKGKTRVKRVFAGMDAMRGAFGPIETIPPWRWRRLHNDIENGGFDPKNL